MDIQQFNEVLTQMPEFNVATITSQFALNTELDIPVLHQCFDEIFGIVPIYDIRVRRNNLKRRVFFNCMAFYIVIRSRRIHVKIFRTGSVHVAGCLTIEHVHKIPKIIFHMIKKCTRAILSPEMFAIDNVRISMIYGVCSTDITFNREAMFHFILHHHTNDVRFRPDVHNGVIMKYENITVIMFHTGKIIFTGGNDICQYKVAYDHVHDILKTQAMDNPPYLLRTTLVSKG